MLARMLRGAGLAMARLSGGPKQAGLPHALDYRPDIDGLRAIAVSIVVVFHAFPLFVGGGFVGVDIFFVISGYLISKIIIKSLESNTFTFTDFYIRRVKRIFPALILVLCATMLTGWFALFPDEFQLLAKHVVGGAGFIANLFLWFEVGYFDTAADTKPLLHLWSLGIEEQFYIFWPIILLCAHRLGARALRVALLIVAVSFLVNVAGVHRFPSATFYSIASRAWELLLGATVAMLSLKKFAFSFGQWRHGPSAGQQHTVSGPIFDTAAPGGRNLLSLVGMAFLVAACIAIKANKSFPGWWALLPAGGAALLIAAGPSAWFNKHVLSNRLLVWIGVISYPLYLWHWPLLSFARIIESGEPSPSIRGAAVGLAVLLAWLTYRFVETPLRHRRSGARQIAVGLVVLMLAIAAGGAWVYHRHGLPSRSGILENASLQKALIIVEDRDNAAACKKRYGFETIYEYCLLAHVDKAPTVALIGDSHGYHVVAGLTKYYDGLGGNLLYLGTRLPFWGVAPRENDPYQLATPQMLELALKTDSIKTVIISTFVKFNNDTAADKLLLQQFRETLQKYVSAGKHVIYMYDVPTLDFEPRACIKRAGIASSKTKRDCSITRAAFDKNVLAHNAAVASVLDDFPTVSRFSASKYLCDDASCHVIIDKKLMYRDTHHLSYEGDLYIGEQFGREQDASLHQKP